MLPEKEPFDFVGAMIAMLVALTIGASIFGGFEGARCVTGPDFSDGRQP